MQPADNPIEVLAQRVREGDYEAKGQLRRQLERSLTQIVRPVLERGTAASTLERNILLAAEQLPPWVRHSSDAQKAALLAESFCQFMIDRLWPGSTEEFCQATLGA
jgi:hypothetical protein